MFFLTILAFATSCYIFNTDIRSEIPSDIRDKQLIPWGIKAMEVPSLWDNGLTGKGVKVAVLDGGIDHLHPDLVGNVKLGFNAINPQNPPIDETGHGTFVAGIIGAKNNNFGIVGVAPDVDLYPVKVLDSYDEGDITDIDRGIDWCIENGIQIINMSFAMNNNKAELLKSINKAISAGIIVVSSSSNSYGGDVGFPASYDDVFSVTAVDKQMNISKKAAKGKIDFSAPGINIISTAMNNEYEQYSGNSFAAPYLTGFIALILQDPKQFGITEPSFQEIKNVLLKYSLDLGKKGSDDIFGSGFVIYKKNNFS